MPDTDFVYVADDEAFPYGAKEEHELVGRIVTLMGELIAAHRPELICVIAAAIPPRPLHCRLCAKPIRSRSSALVPAIKPACRPSVSRRVSSARYGGNSRARIGAALIRDYAGDCQVTLVGSKNLAAFAEAEPAGAPAEDAAVAAEIGPCSARTAPAPTRAVLACTHYPLILERLRPLAPWPVNFIDPAPAIPARRVVSLLGAAPAETHVGTRRGRFPLWARSIGRVAGFGIHSGEPAATGTA